MTGQTNSAVPPLVSDVLRAIREGFLQPPPAAHLLGIRVVDVAPGRARLSLMPAASHLNGNGKVHGGLLATLADFAVVCSVNDVPATTNVVTAALNLTYQRPVTLSTGEVLASGELVHLRGRTALVRATLTDLAGELYVHATGTCIISP
jgi:acyl-CoA thioesterase